MRDALRLRLLLPNSVRVQEAEVVSSIKPKSCYGELIDPLLTITISLFEISILEIIHFGA